MSIHKGVGCTFEVIENNIDLFEVLEEKQCSCKKGKVYFGNAGVTDCEICNGYGKYYVIKAPTTD